MNKNIALIGNPNSGKTTLFNTLTGTYQKTGNWTGVTTEQKAGVYKKDKSIKIIDLPGLYSLSAYGEDEKAVLKYLKNTPPEVIINVVDGTNLERNLYLTLELIALGIPVVVAVNMYDDLQKNNIKLSVEELSKFTGTPVIAVSALKNVNVDKLVETAISMKTSRQNKKELKTYKTPKEIYSVIENNIDKIIQKKQTKAERLTLKADSIITHKFFGLPIFFVVITLVYFLSLKIGGAVSGVVLNVFDKFAESSKCFFENHGVPEWLNSLVCSAMIKGLGTVLSFLPQILVLFFLLVIIEESGYASRIAFILDRFFRAFGLSGKSIIPMFLSCGCTVTGLMSTRTIESKNERRMTIFLAPFMPCGAKTAVFGWMSYVFFDGNALIASSMYFLGIICVAVFGFLLKRFKFFSQDSGTFILEMPTYRLPSVKDVFLTLREKVKEFILKAGGIVFLVTVSLWLLKNFGFSGYTFGNAESSFMYIIGNALKWLFVPLGFGNWQATVAMLSSVLAKEAVVESLSMVSLDPKSLFDSAYSVYAFMAFVLISPPCVASIATAKRELNSKKLLACMLIFQTCSAYIVALIINGIGILLNWSTGLLFSMVIVIIMLMLIVTAVIMLKKTACKNCLDCKKGRKCTKHNTI